MSDRSLMFKVSMLFGKQAKKCMKKKKGGGELLIHFFPIFKKTLVL